MGEFFIYSLFIGFLIQIFPIFVHLDVYLNAFENRCWFCISFYKHVKIFSGYVQLTKEGIIFHLTKKKAILLTYDKMKDTKSKFELTKGFQLYKFHQVIETGNVNAPISILWAALLQILSGQICSVVQTKHPFLSLKNTVLLSECREFKLTFHAVTVFNWYVVMTALIKKALEAIIKWIKTKKSTTSWKKQHSN